MWKLKIGDAEEDELLTTTNNHIGRQYWEFDPNAGTPHDHALIQTLREEFKKTRFSVRQSSDLLVRLQLRKENPCPPIPQAVKVKETETISEEAVRITLKRAISFFSSLQAFDGHWPAESAGPLFFIPPMVIALYVTGAINTVLSSEHQKEIKRYVYNHQNEDGGWGFHIEGHSTMFGSALNYISLRLLGEGPEGGEDMAIAKGRNWILKHGGLLAIPSWGKLLASILGLYEWSGCNPVPPEFWLLPQSFPIHPGNMLCYARLVYMPMSYLYGKRYVYPINGLIRRLRMELYNEPYDHINWTKARNIVAKEDIYFPHPLIQDVAWDLLYYVGEPLMSKWPFSMLRERALKVAMEHVHYEDENSKFLCVGCMEKFLCLIACWVEDPDSGACKRHLARLPDYFWLAEDGLKIQTFGSQMWETGFATRAIISSNLCEEYGSTLRKAHEFIKASQVRENPTGNFKAMYRHTSKGGWTFSTQDHSWVASDTTAEGLKFSLLLSQMSPELVGKKMETEHLYDAVNVILSLQSRNGGFPAWEQQRAFRWVEKFNPTEFFEDALIEREYVECTSSAIQALTLFRKLHPNHRRLEVDRVIAKGAEYMEEAQNPDGSWYGCWGICYTYGTWFGVEGLAACGRNYRNSSTIRKACEFLLSKQLPCGGWGESYLSSQNKVYTNLAGDRANLVQTAWALLALINAGQADVDPIPIHRGVRTLINSQRDDGDFPQQEITGVFMRNSTLHYASYRNIFPIWALGEYRRKVLFA